MADTKPAPEYARIRALRQVTDFNVGGGETFEEGDVIEIPADLLQYLSPESWERVGKTTKCVRNPLKIYGVSSTGQRVHVNNTPDDVKQAEADAKLKPTKYGYGKRLGLGAGRGLAHAGA